MARYWIGHSFASAGIAAVVYGLGWYIDSVAGRGTVPYFNQVVNTAASLLQMGALPVGALYFAAGIPRVRRQEQDRELADIGHDTARWNAMTNRERARRRFFNFFGGP